MRSVDVEYTITQDAIDLVKEFEGKELAAYLDPVGVLTIGYGYTNRAGFGPGVRAGEVWTEAQAEDMLREGLDRFAQRITRGFTRPPEPHEFGAFLSLAYNIGPGAFLKSTALKRFNAGDTEGAAEALQWFNKAGGKVLRGLVRRRAAEAEMLLGGAVAGEASVKPQTPRKSPAQSGTVLGALASGGGASAIAVKSLGSLDPAAQIMVVAFVGVAVLGALWVIRERLKKWAAGDR